MDYQIVLDKVISISSEYGIKVIGAIAIWIIGSWAIKKLMKAANALMDKSNYDESLKKFLLNLAGIVLKVLLVLSILGNLGIQTTSFAAVLASAGLAIGLALQGSLSNFAGIGLGVLNNIWIFPLAWPCQSAINVSQVW